MPDEELTKARNMLKGRLVLGLEDPRSITSFGLRGTILEGEPREIPEVLAGLDAVTAEDVGRVAKDAARAREAAPRSDRAVRGRGALRGPAGLSAVKCQACGSDPGSTALARLGLDAVEALIQARRSPFVSR